MLALSLMIASRSRSALALFSLALAISFESIVAAFFRAGFSVKLSINLHSFTSAPTISSFISGAELLFFRDAGLHVNTQSAGALINLSRLFGDQFVFDRFPRDEISRDVIAQHLNALVIVFHIYDCRLQTLLIRLFQADIRFRAAQSALIDLPNTIVEIWIIVRRWSGSGRFLGHGCAGQAKRENADHQKARELYLNIPVIHERLLPFRRSDGQLTSR